MKAVNSQPRQCGFNQSPVISHRASVHNCSQNNILAHRWEGHGTNRHHLLVGINFMKQVKCWYLLATLAKLANKVTSIIKTYMTDLHWCRLQRPHCRTTCAQQSSGSEWVFRSCQSRWSTSSQEFLPLRGSWPDSSCSPFVWPSESDKPRPHHRQHHQHHHRHHHCHHHTNQVQTVHLLLKCELACQWIRSALKWRN